METVADSCPGGSDAPADPKAKGIDHEDSIFCQENQENEDPNITKDGFSQTPTKWRLKQRKAIHKKSLPSNGDMKPSGGTPKPSGDSTICSGTDAAPACAIPDCENTREYLYWIYEGTVRTALLINLEINRYKVTNQAVPFWSVNQSKSICCGVADVKLQVLKPL